MKLLEIINSNLSNTEKESRVSALFHFDPPSEIKHNSKKEDSFYTGLAQAALSTPFMDYYSIYQDLKSDTHLIDYGSAYSKGTLLFEALGEKECHSYEYLENRVLYTQELLKKLHLNPNKVYQCNLLSADIPIGDAYLIYIPLGELFFRLIHKLYNEGKAAIFYIIESHGDFLDYVYALKEWFKLEKIIDSHTERHQAGVHKFIFSPKEVNTNDLLYKYILEYDNDYKLSVIEDTKEREILLKESLPIKYNDSMAIESFELKRIIDNKIIHLKNPHLVIGE